MNLSIHFVVCAFLAVLLYPYFGWIAVLVFAGGFLIDLDHFLWNALKFRNWKIWEAYQFHIENVKANNFDSVQGIMLVFHTLEVILLVTVLAFFSEVWLMVAVGLVVHMVMDMIHTLQAEQGLILEPSLIYWSYKQLTK